MCEVDYTLLGWVGKVVTIQTMPMCQHESIEVIRSNSNLFNMHMFYTYAVNATLLLLYGNGYEARIHVYFI